MKAKVVGPPLLPVNGAIQLAPFGVSLTNTLSNGVGWTIVSIDMRSTQQFAYVGMWVPKQQSPYFPSEDPPRPRVSGLRGRMVGARAGR